MPSEEAWNKLSTVRRDEIKKLLKQADSAEGTYRRRDYPQLSDYDWEQMAARLKTQADQTGKSFSRVNAKGGYDTIRTTAKAPKIEPSISFSPDDMWAVLNTLDTLGTFWSFNKQQQEAGDTGDVGDTGYVGDTGHAAPVNDWEDTDPDSVGETMRQALQRTVGEDLDADTKRGMIHAVTMPAGFYGNYELPEPMEPLDLQPAKHIYDTSEY